MTETKFRIWVGKEMEGPLKGLDTVFVESAGFTEDLGHTILETIYQYEAQAVYFGAGRIDLVSLDVESFSSLIQALGRNGIKVTIEATHQMFMYYSLYRMFRGVDIIFVQTLDLPKGSIDHLHELYFKVDDGDAVLITKAITQYRTPLTDLHFEHRGLYGMTDKLVAEGII